MEIFSRFERKLLLFPYSRCLHDFKDQYSVYPQIVKIPPLFHFDNVLFRSLFTTSVDRVLNSIS